MSKYCGQLGFAITSETSPGIWEDTISERKYYGDVTRNTRTYGLGSSVNGEVNINNQFSILADPFALENIQNIRYLTWMGTKWVVTSIEVEYPRLTMTVGGVYNGEQT